MWILWLFTLFIEDTVYVTSRFPYGNELSLTFPSSSFYFSVPDGNDMYSIFSSSFLYKKYGNLTSISLRGTRTQDISFELEGVPLKSSQNDYVDLSLFPMQIIKNVVVVTHPLSSYNPSMGSAGGIFAKLGTSRNTLLKFKSDKTIGLLFDRGNKLRFIGEGAIRYDSLKWYRRTFAMVENRNATLMFALRDATTSGPSGSGITGRKRDLFLGYRFNLLDGKNAGFSIKGNISSLIYAQYSIKDIHTGFSGVSLLRLHPFVFTYTHEAVSSTRAGFRIRNIPTLSIFETVHLIGMHISFSAGLSYNENQEKIYTSYFYGMAKNTGLFTIYFNLSKGAHLPSFFDLYWGKDAFSEGNPELQGETIFQNEAGIKGITSNSRIRLNIFKKDVENMIQWIEVSGRYKPFNIGERTIKGIEIRVEHEIGNVYAGYSATWNWFNNILYMPHAEEGFWLDGKFFNIHFTYTGERLKRPSSPKKLPAFELVGIRFHKSSKINGRSYTFVVGIENLLSERIEWLPGFVDSDRKFYARFEIKQ